MNFSQSKSWAFHNPVEVHFGAGIRRVLAKQVHGKSVLVVTTTRGRKQFNADAILSKLEDNAKLTWVDTVQPNPGLAETQVEIDRLSGQHFDAVIAFGGGSAMDAAKALAAALTPEIECRDLALLIADPGKYLTMALLPIHAVTTTSGTGSEVTLFATIWDHENKKKLSLLSPRLFPKTAIVDPELTYGIPHATTLSTGLDALNQAFESVWNKNRTPLSTLFAARAIALALQALPKLNTDLNNHAARAAIAEASLLAGLCISQTRTAICHSISYPLTAHFDVPHGLACAFTMRAVARICLEGAPEGLQEVALINGYGSADSLIAALENLLEELHLDKFTKALLPDTDALVALGPEMVTPGRSDNFILPVDGPLLEKILRSA